ncbi:MAG: hypothetical protein HQK51_05430 [Oligoflexia bacterium]|nr:hypothetical protein [Oligoflexia bacterium]
MEKKHPKNCNFKMLLLLLSVLLLPLSNTYSFTVDSNIKTTALVNTDTNEIKTFLTRFHQNPNKVIKEKIIKRNSKGDIIADRNLTDEQIYTLSKIKYEFRNRLIEKKMNRKQNSINTFPEFNSINSAYLDDDLVDNIVYNRASIVRNIFDIDKTNLTKAQLEVQPWSDDYWPFYKGVLAFRYADPNLESVEEDDKAWENYHKNFLKNPTSNYISSGKIDLLSPAEKYDLLVGDDEKFSMTKLMWEEGEEYYKSSGKVETWMGICHGWAVASFMSPRPLNPVTVNSFNNKYKITFYPSDIKALYSLFWANSNYPQYLIGGRCGLKEKDKEIKRDSTSGRILDPECFDTNPGTWHMSVVNQLGVSKKSFIIDAAYDYEVWNQPMISYEYTYFNPENFENYNDAKSATILLKEYTKDKFKSFRSVNAEYVVGIKMKITYGSETTPHHLNDSPTLDSLITASYIYDLELDKDGKIIGGEWYNDSHPDFLWTPDGEVKPYIILDKMISNKWNPLTESLPANWAEYAKKASQFKIPLGRIIFALNAASRNEKNYFEE